MDSQKYHRAVKQYAAASRLLKSRIMGFVLLDFELLVADLLEDLVHSRRLEIRRLPEEGSCMHGFSNQLAVGLLMSS